MKLLMNEEVELPKGITASAKGGEITIKGPKGELSRSINTSTIKIETEGEKIMITCEKATKREKRMINTFIAHIENMIEGVQNPYVYVLKICSGHFPMNVAVSGETLTVKNFLGEKSPRTLKLKKGVNVKVEGDKITVESPNKDLAGQMASDIELLTVKRNRDLRVFQDGIYMIEKAGKVWQ